MRRKNTAKKTGSGAARKPPARKKPESVAQYLAGVPEPARATLKKLRAAIRAAAPKQAVETISYGMPALRYRGVLLWFAAFADHCSLFPTAAIIEKFRDHLKGYSLSKGTIQFPSDKPLPAALVKKIVQARVAQVDGQVESRKRR